MISNVKAIENDYSFNDYSFGFYDTEYELIYIKVIVDCDYPEDIPHYYEPNPIWNPGYLDTYEEIMLTGPNFSSVGNIDSGIFFIGIETPLPGRYEFKVVDNGTDVLYSHNFTVNEKYNVIIDDVKWITNAHSFQPSYFSSIDISEAKKIGGIKLSLILENLGDIPYGIGSPNTQDLNIDYKINLYKEGNTEPIFSMDYNKLTRPADLFEGQGYRDQNFFKSGETINCIEEIINDTLYIDNIGSGSYSIDGYVRLRNLTYEFSSSDAIIVTGAGTPGFDIFIALLGIIIIIYFRKRF